MQQRIIEIDTEIMAEAPNAQRIVRSSLLAAVLETMDRQALQRMQRKHEDRPAPVTGNRHERRKAAAMARRIRV